MTNLGIVRLLKDEHARLTKQIQGISARRCQRSVLCMRSRTGARQDVGGCPSQNRRCSKSAMGKAEGKEQADKEHRPFCVKEETNNVRLCP
jgi:hypothetical protein